MSGSPFFFVLREGETGRVRDFSLGSWRYWDEGPFRELSVAFREHLVASGETAAAFREHSGAYREHSVPSRDKGPWVSNADFPTTLEPHVDCDSASN